MLNDVFIYTYVMRDCSCSQSTDSLKEKRKHLLQGHPRAGTAVLVSEGAGKGFTRCPSPPPPFRHNVLRRPPEPLAQLSGTRRADTHSDKQTGSATSAHGAGSFTLHVRPSRGRSCKSMAAKVKQEREGSQEPKGRLKISHEE